jgi:hypothetical protein
MKNRRRGAVNRPARRSTRSGELDNALRNGEFVASGAA